MNHRSILAFIACLLFSTAFVNIKIGLEYITPGWFAGIRFFLAGLIIVPFLPNKRTLLKEALIHWKIIVITAFFMTFLQYSLLYLGVNRVDGSIAAIFNGSSPVFVVIMAHFFMPNDQFSKRKFIISILGIAGIILITFQKLYISNIGLSYLIGILLLILVNISSSIANIIVAKKSSLSNPIALSSLQLILGGIMLLIYAFIVEPLPTTIYEPVFYYSLGWLIMVSAIAVSLWIYLLQQPGEKVSSLNIWKFVIPVFGATWNWLLIKNDKPDTYSVIGMTLISVAIILNNTPKRNQR